MRNSPRLHSHASGVVLGITQIINGLDNPVSKRKAYQRILSLCLQLVVAEVANKFAQSHFTRGVRDTNVRLLTKIVIQYVQVNSRYLQYQTVWFHTIFRRLVTTRPLQESVMRKCLTIS